MIDGQRQPPRWVVRRVACPTCGAEPGQPCRRQRPDGQQQRKRHHIARVQLVADDLEPRSQTSTAAAGAVTAVADQARRRRRREPR